MQTAYRCFRYGSDDPPAAVSLFLEMKRFGALCEELNVPPHLMGDVPADVIDQLQEVRNGLNLFRDAEAKRDRKNHA